MIRKFGIILITTLALSVNSFAASDGELLLKKNEPSEIKDCFEGLNRASFAFNQALDGVIFKPVASVYKKIPSPVKIGVSNSLSNLSNLVTIPNNLLQGDLTLAGINTGRFLIYSTVGVLGIIDVAKYISWKLNKNLVSIPTILSVDAFTTPAAGVRINHDVEYLGEASPNPLIIDYDLLK